MAAIGSLMRARGIGSQPRLGNRVVRSSNPVAFDDMERAVVDMRERFLSIGEHISGLLSTLTQQIDTAPPAARASINSAAQQIARTQQKLRLQMTNLPTHPEERYQIMRSLLQAQSGALQQLSIIVQQFTPQYDQRDGLASLSLSDNDYDYDLPPPAPRGVIQPLPNEHYAPPTRRAARKAKPPPLPAEAIARPAQRMQAPRWWPSSARACWPASPSWSLRQWSPIRISPTSAIVRARVGSSPSGSPSSARR